MKEVWKDIEGYEGLYQVSSIGRVRSLDRFVERSTILPKTGARCEGMFLRGKVKKPLVDNKGYNRIQLCKRGKQSTKKVHRLVAAAFIEKVEGKTYINHKNGIKMDNNFTNLEWCTNEENVKHAWGTGLIKPVSGVKNKKCLLNERQVKAIRTWLKLGYTQLSIGEAYGVSRSVIAGIKKGKTYKDVPV